MKNKLTQITLLAIAFFSIVTYSFAQFVAPQPFYKSGTAWIMNSATETLGNASNRIATIYAGTVDTQTLTISAVTSGATTLATTTVEHFTKGGRVYATSTTDTTAVFLEADMRVARVDFTPNVPGTTLTLTSTSSITNLVANDGDEACFRVVNATTTAGANGQFTLAVPTGMTLKNSSTTAVMRSGDASPVCLHRKTNTDILVFIDPR